MLKKIFLLILTFLVSCSKKLPPEGERSLVSFGGAQKVEKDVEADNYRVILHDLNTDQNPEFLHEGRNKWIGSVGKVTTRALLEVAPVFGGGKLYTMDITGSVIARDAETGVVAWSLSLVEDPPEYIVGGGLCYDHGVVFAAMPIGVLAAIDVRSGKELWRVKLDDAIRTAPVANANFVFTLTVSNKLICIDARTGKKLWIDEAQSTVNSVSGGPAPLLVGADVIVGHTTGEISALRQENGHVHWRNTVRAESEMLGLEEFLSWKADFKYQEGSLYVVHPVGSVMSIDVRSGQVRWKVNTGHLSSVALGKNVLFAIDMIGRVVCLERIYGKVLWISQLPVYEDLMQKVKVPLHWFGPVIAGGKLWFSGTDGALLEMEATNGKILTNTKLATSAFYMPPTIAHNKLYLVTQNGEIFARR
ncbi:MAG: PQQ-binding-like beta-propeller repeat protein [Alphaproteobacteria bacterium]|nr:PQQ-binding-like beta-propeller repeat protein [Alphaproteobacteria bacterium]